MILYLTVAIAVFIYYINSRDISFGKSIGLAIIWPVIFLMYLFTMMTGRSARAPFTAMSGRQGGQGRGRGRKRR
jgi:formate hydrogenlyase subunit 4